MTRILFALALTLGVGGVVAAGDDTFDVKFAEAKVGDVGKISKVSEGKRTVVMGAPDKATPVEIKSTLIYTETILAKPNADKRPTKLSRVYETAEKSNAGKITKLPFDAKMVVVEKTGDKFTFTIDDKVVDGKAVPELEREFNDGEEESGTFEKDLTPGKPVKLNEVWTVKTERLFGKANPLIADPAKSTATARLLKVQVKDGKLLGTIELTIAAVIKQVKLNAPMPLTANANSTIEIKGEMVVCIDGTSPQGVVKTTTTTDIAADVPTGKFSVKGTDTQTMTIVPVK